jgi:hypothetical protein
VGSATHTCHPTCRCLLGPSMKVDCKWIAVAGLLRPALAECRLKPDLIRQSTPLGGVVLHLVRHGSSRLSLSADCASLFEMSRSSPSWVPQKSACLTYCFHFTL